MEIGRLESDMNTWPTKWHSHHESTRMGSYLAELQTSLRETAIGTYKYSAQVRNNQYSTHKTDQRVNKKARGI